jgi:hypothetical protein
MPLQPFIELLASFYRRYPLAAKITLVVSGLVLLCIGGIAAFMYLNDINDIRSAADDRLTRIPQVLLLCAALGAIPFMLFVSALRALVPIADTELAPIRKEREEIRDRIKEREPDIFDTIQLNLNQLSEYYTINKSQARNSFTASMTAIVIGFITIIFGIWIFYFGAQPNLTYLSVAGGILAQFIGGAYFYLYNKSLAQLNFFFERLTTVQDTMLSIKLCDQILEAPVKMKVLEQLIFQIITRDASTRRYLADGIASQLPPASSQKKSNKSNVGNDVKKSVAPHVV